jgi:mRNA interferase MazF
MTCDAFEVVVVPFPFTNSDQSVRRPAAVLSRRAFNAEGHTVKAIITDARNQPWPLDIRMEPSIRGIEDGERRPDEVLHPG